MARVQREASVAAAVAASLRPRCHCALTGREDEACVASWRPFALARDSEDDSLTYRILRCGRCDIGLTDPCMPADKLGLLYNAKASSDFDHITGSPMDVLKDFLARRELAAMLPPGGAAVLDYGTGNGRYTLQAREAGAGLVLAADFQAEAPPALRGGPYLPVDRLEQTDLLFDVILLRHVLEHAPEPVQLLASLGPRLRPGGFLYVEVPNLDSGCARAFGSWWPGHYTPRHFHHFSVTSLRRVVEAAGLALWRLDRKELPLMGNLLADWLGCPRSDLACKLAGVPLFAVQKGVELLAGSSSCLAARVGRPLAS